MITGTDDLEYKDLKARFFREPAGTRKNATLKGLEGSERAAWLRAFDRAVKYDQASSEAACDIADLALHTRKANPHFCTEGPSPGTEGATWERPAGHIGDAGPGVHYQLNRLRREEERERINLEGQVIARDSSADPARELEPIVFTDDGSNYEPYSLPYPDNPFVDDVLPSSDRAGGACAGPASIPAVRAAGEPTLPRGLGAQGHLSPAGEVQ